MSVFDLAVVGAGAESQAAAAALRLAGSWLGTVVVVSDAGPQASIGLPCTPAARRLAQSVGDDNGWVCARGRIVWVRPARDELVRLARRAAARAGAPVVLGLSRPRDEVADVLLAESLRVVVLADPAGPVAALALSQLSALGVDAEARPAVGGASVALARCGWPGPASATLLADCYVAAPRRR